MTIRSLAADMGVSPMSLYRHVRDKDDLLDEVVDRLLVRAWKPRPAEDWKAWIDEAADKFRQFLVTQPAALHVYLHHPVVSPSAVVRMEAMMGVLRDALGDEQAAQTSLRRHSHLHRRLRRPGGVPGRLERPRASGDQLSEQLAAYTTPASSTTVCAFSSTASNTTPASQTGAKQRPFQPNSDRRERPVG